MNITIWTKPKAAITLLLGLIILIIPSEFFGLFGIVIDSAGEVVARMCAAAFFSIGLTLLRVTGPENFSSSDAIYATICDGLVFLVLLSAQLNGQMNALGWVLTATGLCSALGFFWCYLQVKKTTGPIANCNASR